MSSALAAVVVTEGKTRERHNPMVPVSKYMEKLEGFMQKHGSRDICALLKPYARVDWKSAPCPDTMAPFAPFALEWLDLGRNTVLGHKKLTNGVKGCHATAPCVFSARPLRLEAMTISETIRIMMSKFRITKQEADPRRIVFQQARLFFH